MKKYIIFGTGSIAQTYFEQLTKEYSDNCVECFLDSMLSKEFFCNKKVIKPEQLKDLQINNYTYILGTLTSKKSMINELEKQGVKKENIFIEKDYGSNSFEDNVTNVNKILLYPAAENETFLKKIDMQFSTLVPNIKNLSEKPEIVSSSNISLKNINITANEKKINEYDLVLVWDKNRLEDDLLQEAENVYCIDPYYFRLIDIRILLRLNYILEKKEEQEKYIALSKENYKQFAITHSNCNSYVFGTGPSCSVGNTIKFEKNSIRIVCNNLVDNKDLIQKIKPNVYVLADEDIMSTSCIKIVDKICNYILNHECIFIVPDILSAVLINRYPKLIEKMIRVSLDTHKINFPSPEKLTTYRKAYNIITLMAIPVASYLSDKIYIAGCDGINLETQSPNQSAWQHDETLEKQSSQYARKELEQNWNEEYYLKHISYFEEILEYGEQLGKLYIPYTDSYIPALKIRYQKNCKK